MASLETPKVDDYHVACITVVPIEFAAMKQMFDSLHDRPLRIGQGDPNQYAFGQIAGHNIVACCASRAGPDNIATTATDLRRTFTSIKLALLIGIGGGVPSSTCDVRLGDIVVAAPGHLSNGITHHDQGKQLSDGFIQLNFPVPPPRALQGAVCHMQAIDIVKESTIPEIISRVVARLPVFKQPDDRFDLLFRSNYEHVAGNSSCDNCDRANLEPRSARGDVAPRVHYGVIASGSQLVKSGKKRDFLRDTYHVRCIEMEAAGIMDTLPSLVIRGISDYADSHKNDGWQPYAALAAAAYAKELLNYVAPSVGSSRGRLGPNPGQSTAPQPRDRTLEALLDQRARTAAAENWRESIVDLLKALGLKSGLTSREQLAEALWITDGVSGSARRNIALHRALMSKLTVENGDIVFPSYLNQLRY